VAIRLRLNPPNSGQIDIGYDIEIISVSAMLVGTIQGRSQNFGSGGLTFPSPSFPSSFPSFP